MMIIIISITKGIKLHVRYQVLHLILIYEAIPSS